MYASGAMVIFGKMFRDIAEKETRVITTFDDPKLGSESYALVDVYCVAPDCDCRRVMINVIRDRDTKHVATINWAFDPNDPDRGPFLDRLNAQSELSDALLKMVQEDVLPDKNYVARLERHYRMVKKAVADPQHEVHKVLTDVTRKSPENLKKTRATYVAASTDAELAELWKGVGLDVPPELVEETVRRGGRMIPYLGPLLVDEDLWASGPDSKEGWAPAHALKLLNAIGGADASPYVAEFFRRGLGDDWLTDEGDNLILALGAAGIDAIWEVVTDEKADQWGRIIAIDGLALVGLAHESVRETLIARFREAAKPLMEKPVDELTGDESEFLLPLLEALATLHDEPSREWMKKASDEGRCRFSPKDLVEALELFDASFEETLAGLKTDPLEHFSPEELGRFKEMHGLDGSGRDEEDEQPPRPMVRESKKVGRNDPCPCGSGKKYKKCCLAT